MAMTPGGGRSPSAPPPTRSGKTPRPPRPGRETRNGRPRPPGGAAEASVLRWSLLIGGLIIIADLGTLVIEQRIAAGPDVLNAIEIADQVVSIVLYSLVGVAVQRETGQVYLGALAGLVAGLLDGIILAAAASMAPRPGDEANAPEAQLLFNVVEGALLAAVSAWFSALARRRAGR